MSRVWQTLLGLALITVGVAGFVWEDERGDLLIICFIALGGFIVSKSLIIEFFEKVWKIVRGQGNS